MKLQARLDESVRRDGMTADALHVGALLGLIWQSHRENVVDTSIAYLRTAAGLARRPAAPLADLAAAKLAKSRFDDDPRRLFEALEAADSSLELESSAAAAFNAAMALQQLHLSGQARSAWSRYESIEPDVNWRREARDRARSIPDVRLPDPSPDANGPALEAFARQWPHRARLIAFDRWLGEWGTAIVQGRDDEARRLLDAAVIVGKELAARGADRSLLDAAVAARSTTGDSRRALAESHRLYYAAQRAALDLEADTAALHFRALLRLEPPEPLRSWAMLGLGIALVAGGDPLERGRLLDAVASSANTARYPILVSRGRWALGTVAVRDGRYDKARRHYESAIREVESTGETEYVGALTYLIGETYLNEGDRLEGYRRMVRSLDLLQETGPSVWMHNALIITSRFLEGDGLSRAALRLSNEDVDVIERMTDPLGLGLRPAVYRAEALVARTRLMWRYRPDSLYAAIQKADSLLGFASGFTASYIGAQLRYARASINAETKPAEAIVDASSVIGTFDPAIGARTRNAGRHLGALLIRSRAYIAAGEVQRGIADLDAAVDLIDSVRVGISREGNRHTLADATRDVIDKLVVLRISQGRVEEALHVSERARIATRSDNSLSRPSRMGMRRVIVTYRSVGEELLAWVVSRGTVTLTRVPVDRERLANAIARVRTGLERRAEEEMVRRELSWLYDQMVRPIASRLDTADSALTVVPDGILAGVPFGALYDDREGEYWIEQREIRVESSVHDALAAEEGGEGSRNVRLPISLVLVADPAFDARAHRDRARLPNAQREVAAIDSIYSGRGVVVAGEAASTDSVRALLARASVVHYAGHAIADEAHPEASFLLLAPSPNDSSPLRGRLTADSLRALRNPDLRLVVLAACGTLGSSTEGSTGFRGLASALRRAGARGVVGSLWRVDDEATRELMVRFHAAYARHGRGPAALRSAQLDLIRGKQRPRLKSPSAWAGFQYTGS